MHLLFPIYTIAIAGVFYFVKKNCLYIENIFDKYEIKSSENEPNLYFQQNVTPIFMYNFVSYSRDKMSFLSIFMSIKLIIKKKAGAQVD